MGSQSPSISISRWHRPRVYGTIVGIYVLLCGGGALSAGIAVIFVWFPIGLIFGGVWLATAAICFLASITLLTEPENRRQRQIEYAALVVLFGDFILTFLTPLHPEQVTFESYLVWAFIFSINAVMFVFLYKRYSGRPKQGLQ